MLQVFIVTEKSPVIFLYYKCDICDISYYIKIAIINFYTKSVAFKSLIWKSGSLKIPENTIFMLVTVTPAVTGWYCKTYSMLFQTL